MKKNVKGFTLIELLAVIVILAILIAVAVPAITRYLATARIGSMQNAASELINTARTYTVDQNVGVSGELVFTPGSTSAVWYPSKPAGAPAVTINNILEKPYTKSPNGTYTALKVVFNVETSQYTVCVTDGIKTINKNESDVQGSNSVVDYQVNDCVH